ncbi:MAG: hypothetical protein RL637_331 [Pseudomonadota bacterium]|jgi:hypothetical protein
MTNWENETMDIITGETPRQKFDYIKSLMWENAPEKEAELLNTVYLLKEKGKQMYKEFGSESYSLRCAIYDAAEDIYKLTNKCKKERKTLNQWLNEVERLRRA